MVSQPDEQVDASTPPLTRGHKKRERTREQLISAGLALLSTKGEALTVSDVVIAAEVSNGTFYNYYADRDDLLSALAERSLFDFIQNSTANMDTTDPAYQFAITTTRVLNRAHVEPAWGRIFLRLTEAPRSAQSTVGVGLLEIFTRGFVMGRFTPVPDVITLDAIFGLVSLSVRRFTYQELPKDHPQLVVARGLMILGMSEEEGSRIAKEAAAFAETPIRPPLIA